ncbi:CD109 antigen isoform X2 [Brienomyrus brachyistius]|uniref:CD109 antigen isoform X2 n=1 Tax=Brienomyrus brachyistius TaxID=42636 RepID=UPI0020B371AF|nr:CD109 antigen isoform X2 [Brienomyrus brachyistius]
MEQLVWMGICGLFVTCTGAQNISRPSYLVSVPRVIRIGTPISLSVTVFTESPVRVTAELFNGITSLRQTEKTFPAGSTGLQILPPILGADLISQSNYTLAVSGFIGENVVFSNTTVMKFIPKISSTFIQTDKSVYKPGQAVKIRVVSVYPDGKPSRSNVNIVIKDPKGNMIQQWPSLDSFLGVVSREFQLTKTPPLGMWTVEASVNDISTEKTFTVDYYVLPAFDVVVQAPAITYYGANLTGNVTAQHSYGKPVQGTLTITASLSHHGMAMTASKTSEINGSVRFVFNKKDFFHSYTSGQGSMGPFPFKNEAKVYVTVTVTETLTGLRSNATSEVTVVQSRYHLLFYGHPRTLNPSLNFSTYLKISSYNGEPIERMRNVTVTVTQHKGPGPGSWRHEGSFGFNSSFLQDEHVTQEAVELTFQDAEGSPLSMSFPVPEDGVIPIRFQLLEDVTSLTIQADFQGNHKILQVFRSSSSTSKFYLQLSRTNAHLEVGIPINLVVQSNFLLTEVHYLVMSKDRLLDGGRKTAATFSLLPRASWAPVARVTAYVVCPTGEVVSDTLMIPVAQTLRNNVSLGWSLTRTKPAGKVELSVHVSEPGSLVGILVVDKATDWPKSDNDISKYKVLEKLESAACSGDDIDSPSGVTMTGDANCVSMVCNLVVLTDGWMSRAKDHVKAKLLRGKSLQEDSMTAPVPRVRRRFPDTWLWLNANMSVSTTASFSVSVPDSITTWIATAFVVSDNLGLGIIDSPAKLAVFQNFFLFLVLPAYIIRGEQLILEVIVFNYMEQQLEVLVTVAENKSFEFIFRDKNGPSMANIRTVSVASWESALVLFPIRPEVLGEITVSVKAESYIGSDAIVRKVLVKPEGTEKLFTKSLFLEMPLSENRLSEEVVFSFPADVVPGSKRAHVTVAGDILGPSISGLDSLLQMPSGCGEQNMINFAPSIYVLQYLTKADRGEPINGEPIKEDIRRRALTFMEQGYQQQLTYQRRDGSFSAFGDSDSAGSTWLSAFVLRAFLQARSFIPIDQKVLSGMATWLVQQQEASGCFGEPGRVTHSELRGGLDGPTSLTAYVLMALLEEPAYMNIYSSQVSSARMFLETKLGLGISSNYSLSLVAYALSLAKSPKAEMALMELMRRADVHDGMMSWSSSKVPLPDSWQPQSVDIEIASYVLLTLFMRAKVMEGILLLKWLCQQRNHLGGYGSTQDTIMALHALSYYAPLSGADSINTTIQVKSTASRTAATFHVDSSNYLLHQSEEIETSKSMRLAVSMEGRGFALLQLNVFYNVKNEEASSKHKDGTGMYAFHLDVVVNSSRMDQLTLSVCTSLLESQKIPRTDMVLMEVGLLSGFTLSDEGIATNDLIRRVETQPGKVILYLDSVTTSQVCVEISTVRSFKVALVQDANVIIYDYYEPRRRAMRTYNAPTLRSLPTCSFCGLDCHLCRPAMLRPSSTAPAASASRPPLIGCPTALFVLFLLQLPILTNAVC